jgi:UPF0716 protein FxsA
MPLLLLLFLAVPVAELYVIIQVGQAIGVIPTLAILFLDGFVGAALARSQGRTAWARFNQALAEGRVPARETADGAMIILGGALLLTPGFLTDVLGLALLLPPTRALFRNALGRIARRRVSFAWTVASPPPRPFGRRAPGSGEPRSRPQPPGSGYDYEGSAREVDEPELPPGRRDG